MSDALNQVLDLVKALELYEASDQKDRQIEWRLIEANTSSPPLTITAEAYSRSEDLPVLNQAERVVSHFTNDFNTLLRGSSIETVARKPIMNLLERNLRSIVSTDILFDEHQPILIHSESAFTARQTLIGQDLNRYIEIGTIQGVVSGIRTYHGRPAFEIIDRLYEKRRVCVLKEDRLAEEIGSKHQWYEVWEGKSVDVSGYIRCKDDGEIEFIDVETVENTDWTQTPVDELPKLDLLKGRSPMEHLNILREEFDDEP